MPRSRPKRPVAAPASRRPGRLAILITLIVVAAATAGWLLVLGRRGDALPLSRHADQNVLLITIDTLRADALGSYGGRARTPHLDALARQGARFTFAHAHAVVTLPSHATILTGRYPFEHGVRDNAGFRLADSAVTLAEILRGQGFATGAFVGAFPLDRRFGLAQGFDVYDDVVGQGIDAADFAFSERPAGEVVAAARAWIAQQRRRWLAWVHVFDPHSPYAPPPPFDREYADTPYAGEVAYVDSALGPLVDLARSASRPTLVIVTADHGEGLGDHGELTHGVFAYEPTLRVPLIIAQVGAGRAPRDRDTVSDVPVRHVDILPTIADLLRLPAQDGAPGRTLLTATRGEREPRPAYFEALTTMLKRGWAPLRGVLEGREKYVDLPVQELYDVEADPLEQRNLAPQSRDRVQVFSARLGALNATLPGEQATEDAEVRRRLQALGYVSGSAPRKARYTDADDPKNLIDVDRLMIEGIELHRARRDADAMDAYRRVIARRPDMGLAYRRLAYIQWEGGATAAAIATLRQALERNGPDRDIEVRLGTYLAEAGGPAEAIAILERAMAADPTDPEAINALGIAFARGGRTDEALHAFERALALDPRDAFALENAGAVHLQRGDLAAAADAFARAISHNPRSSRAHAGLGVVAMKNGRRDEAIEHWRRAVELDPANYDALYNVAAELVGAGRLDEARPYVERFVRTAPPAFYGRDIERFRQFIGPKARHN